MSDEIREIAKDVLAYTGSGEEPPYKEEIVVLAKGVVEMRNQVEKMDRILEACWRYFDHCLRVSLPRESCDSGEMMVRLTLMRDAMRLLGLIGPLPGEGDEQ